MLPSVHGVSSADVGGVLRILVLGVGFAFTCDDLVDQSDDVLLGTEALELILSRADAAGDVLELVKSLGADNLDARVEFYRSGIVLE